jgi:hypothetical protein
MAGTFVHSDAVHRASAGECVQLIAPEAEDLQPAEGVTVLGLPHTGLFGTPGALARARANPLRLAGLPVFAAHLAWLLRQAVAGDRVVAHWLFPCGGAAHLGAARGIAIEHVVHGADLRLLASLGALGRLYVDRLAERPNAHFHCVSASIEARLLKVAPKLLGRTIVAPMPLCRSIEKAKARTDIAREPGLFVVACRLVAEKKIERALHFARSKRGRVVMLGDGPERAKLFRTAAKLGVLLTLLGERPQHEVFEWMMRAQQVLVPLARDEGNPTVILEARALGLDPLVFEAEN